MFLTPRLTLFPDDSGDWAWPMLWNPAVSKNPTLKIV
jgi:hypothetical protein